MHTLKTKTIYALKVVCTIAWWIIQLYLFLMSPNTFAEGMEREMGIRT